MKTTRRIGMMAGAMAASVVLSACEATRPEIDMMTITDQRVFQDDAAKCRVMADIGLTPANFANPTFNTDSIGSQPNYAAAGAGGAIVGGLSGAAGGIDPVAGAGAGMVVGIFMAPQQEAMRRTQAAERNYARCLEDKGYRIVNRDNLWMRHWCGHLMINHYQNMDKKAYDACKEWEAKRAARLGLPVE